MNLYKRIDTTTGNFIEDCLFESHPILMTTVTEEITLDDGTTQLIESVVPLLDAEGNTQLDTQYILDDVPQGFYLPRWNGEAWVDGGQAPEPQVQPTTDAERIDLLQEAVDFILTAY